METTSPKTNRIGLELQPSRLWVLRKSVFGLGGAQVLATALVLGLAAFAFGLSWQSAMVIGFALAMSSTAFVLQALAEDFHAGGKGLTKEQLRARSGLAEPFTVVRDLRCPRKNRTHAHLWQAVLRLTGGTKRTPGRAVLKRP